MFAQLHGVIGGDFPFAAQDHGAERERLAKDAGQIGSHKAMLVEQVLEEPDGAELRLSDGFLFPLFQIASICCLNPTDSLGINRHAASLTSNAS